jgi:hypothetical protein
LGATEVEYLCSCAQAAVKDLKQRMTSLFKKGKLSISPSLVSCPERDKLRKRQHIKIFWRKLTLEDPDFIAADFPFRFPAVLFCRHGQAQQPCLSAKSGDKFFQQVGRPQMSLLNISYLHSYKRIITAEFQSIFLFFSGAVPTNTKNEKTQGN